MTGPIGILVRKELAELRRDRRVILMTIVLPVLLYPAMIGGMNRMSEKHEQEIVDQTLMIGVSGGAPELRASLEADSTLRFLDRPVEAIEGAVESGEIAGGVILPEALSARGSDAPDTLTVIARLTRESSREAQHRIEARLHAYVQGRRAELWAAAGGRGRPADLLAIVSRDVSTAEEATGAEAGKMLVYLLMMTLFMASSALATDMIAGEKERGTLETLMLAPVDRRTIARAKLLVVSCGSAMTGILSLLSLSISYRMGWLATESGQALVLEGPTLVAVALLIVPLAVLLGAILLAVSSWARSLKEAQYYILPVMLIVFVPALMSMNQSIELSAFVALLPVANVAFVMRDVLARQINWPLLMVAFLATVLWITLLIRWVSQRLSKEETLLGFDPEPFFARTAGGRSRSLHLGMVLTVLGFFYLGQWMQAKNLQVGLALSLWVLLPLLAYATIRAVRQPGLDWRRSFGLRPAPARVVVGAVLLGVGVILPIVGGLQPLMARLLPMPAADAARMAGALESLSLWQAFLLASLSPAICEEFVFRGVFLGLLREQGTARRAVVVSSVCFALIHLSVYRFAPTFLLGLLLGTLVARHRSLLPASTAHLVYNGSLLLGGEWYARHWAESGPPIPLDGPVAWIASLGAILAGAWLCGVLPRLRPPAESVS